MPLRDASNSVWLTFSTNFIFITWWSLLGETLVVQKWNKSLITNWRFNYLIIIDVWNLLNTSNLKYPFRDHEFCKQVQCVYISNFYAFLFCYSIWWQCKKSHCWFTILIKHQIQIVSQKRSYQTVLNLENISPYF